MRHEGDRWESEAECPRCGERQWYDEKHDAYFCLREDVWLESACFDRSCSYCRDRPARPSEAPAP